MGRATGLMIELVANIAEMGNTARIYLGSDSIEIHDMQIDAETKTLTGLDEWSHRVVIDMEAVKAVREIVPSQYTL